MISLYQKQYFENISRRVVHPKSIYNSPSNILRIYALIQSYFQKFDKSRRQSHELVKRQDWVHWGMLVWGLFMCSQREGKRTSQGCNIWNYTKVEVCLFCLCYVYSNVCIWVERSFVEWQYLMHNWRNAKRCFSLTLVLFIQMVVFVTRKIIPEGNAMGCFENIAVAWVLKNNLLDWTPNCYRNTNRNKNGCSFPI